MSRVQTSVQKGGAAEGGAGRAEARVRAEAERLAGGALEGRRLDTVARALKALHDRFVAELPPDAPSAPYLADRHALAAYLAYFFPASQAQVARALEEVEPPSRPVLRVLDVGAGPGPATLAVAEWARAHGRTVEATALEPSADALAVLKRLWSSDAGTLQTRTWSASQPLPDGPFDVVVASHVLNELFSAAPSRLDERAQFAAALGRRLSPGGLLVLVEPALKRTGRELLVVRDRLLQGGLVALAPCFFQGACPAIARPRDWCHADRPWNAPETVISVGDAAGLKRESLKFSYVIFSNAPALAERAKDQDLFRIVSEPLPEKGKLRYFGCGPAGRHPLVRLDREATDTNAAFSTLERGDIVRVHGTVASGDGKRVTAQSAVEVVQPAKDLDRGGRA